VFIVPDLTPKK